MTLNQLLIDCCTRLNYPPDLALVDPKVIARFTAFLNQTQLEIFAQPTYRRLLRGQTQLYTTPGQANYGLPGMISRIVAIMDEARQVRLGMLSADQYRNLIPNPHVQLGNPTAYAFDGWSTVQRQVGPADTALYVISSDVADTTPNAIHFTALGYHPNNPPLVAGTYLQGERTVTLDSTLPFPGKLVSTLIGGGFVSNAFLTVPAVGVVSLVEADPTLTPVAQIQPGETRSRSAQIYLAPTPSGVFQLQVMFEREPIPMVDPSSEPMLPTRWHYLLAAGARMKEYELRGDTSRLAIAARELSGGIGFLNAWVSDQPDAGDQMHPDDSRFGGTSVLGPWFPASSYRRY